MRHFALGFLMVSVLVLSGRAEDPTELEKLRDAYQTALDRAARSVSTTYLAELGKLRESFVAKSKLAEANAVQAEIDLIRNRAVAGVSPSLAPVSVNPSSGKSIVLEARASIPANSPNGFKIGPVQKGDVITLSYVGGRWKNHGVVATENPDAEFSETGDASRLAIASGKYKTKAGPLIVLVPYGTAAKPFSYQFLAADENVVLRIQDGGENEAAPGSVTYQVRVIR